MTKLVLVSDTHTYHNQVTIPQCDILVHAGDLSFHGKPMELISFNSWIYDLKDRGTIKEAVIIAGNHELGMEKDPNQVAVEYLSACNFMHCKSYKSPTGLKFFGVPHQLRFFDWAWNTDEQGIANQLSMVPDDVDVLVTHGPPHGYNDVGRDGTHCGSYALLAWIQRAQPKLVVFGHIHAGYSGDTVTMIGNTRIVNASTCTEQYKPTNKPIEVEL